MYQRGSPLSVSHKKLKGVMVVKNKIFGHLVKHIFLSYVSRDIMIFWIFCLTFASLFLTGPLYICTGT